MQGAGTNAASVTTVLLRLSVEAGYFPKNCHSDWGTTANSQNNVKSSGSFLLSVFAATKFGLISCTSCLSVSFILDTYFARQLDELF